MLKLPIAHLPSMYVDLKIAQMKARKAFTEKLSNDPRCGRDLICSGWVQTVRVLSIASRINFISLHALWPIRTPCPICTNQDTSAVATPKRPKANSIHTAARHAWTFWFWRIETCLEVVVEQIVSLQIQFLTWLKKISVQVYFYLSLNFFLSPEIFVAWKLTHICPIKVLFIYTLISPVTHS